VARILPGPTRSLLSAVNASLTTEAMESLAQEALVELVKLVEECAQGGAEASLKPGGTWRYLLMSQLDDAIPAPAPAATGASVDNSTHADTAAAGMGSQRRTRSQVHEAAAAGVGASTAAGSANLTEAGRSGRLRATRRDRL
jgi:hypothetical protein